MKMCETLTVADGGESLDGVLQRDESSGGTGEDLGDLEGLRQEPLDLTSTSYGQFVLLRQLVHTQDSDNILE